MSGYDAVARVLLLIESKIFRAMHHEFVEFFEGALIKQKLDSFPGGHLSSSVLFFDLILAAASFSLPRSLFQKVELVLLRLFFCSHSFQETLKGKARVSIKPINSSRARCASVFISTG